MTEETNDFWQKAHKTSRQKATRRGRPPIPKKPPTTGDTEVDELVAGLVTPTHPPATFRAEAEAEWREQMPGMEGPGWSDEDLVRIWQRRPLRQLPVLAEESRDRARRVLESLAVVSNHPLQDQVEETYTDILFDAGEKWAPWPPDQVPADVWGQVVSGKRHSLVVEREALPLLELTDQPGLDWFMSVDRLVDAYFARDSREPVVQWFEGKQWPVYNFRNQEDLEDFKRRLNTALIGFMTVEDYRDFDDDPIRNLYQAHDEVMPVFHYVPGPSGTWQPHPGAGDGYDTLSEPPFQGSGYMVTWFTTDVTAWRAAEQRGDSPPAELVEKYGSREGLFASYGHRYALLVAKESALAEIRRLGMALRVMGL